MANLVWLRSNLNSDINARLDWNPDPYDILSDMIFHFLSCASTAGFENLEIPPSNLENFRQLSTALFSNSFLDRQRQCFAWLKMQLPTALVGDFVDMQSYRAWLTILVDTMLNENVTVDTSDAGTSTDTLKVRQITLHGKTLKKAWKNFMTEHGSEYRLLDDQDPKWSTARSFYGTTPALYGDTLSSSLLHNLITVPRHERMHDLAPYKILNTEFSATRAFLCAIFRATMVATGISEGSGGLEHSWRYNDKCYSGILLLEFATSTPVATGQRGFCVPKTIIRSWKTTVQQIGNEHFAAPIGHLGIPASELWNDERNKRFHGEQNNAWPDVVHGPERGLAVPWIASGLVSRTRMAMGNTGQSAWRTAHFSPAAHEHLEQNLVGIYAIQYVAEPTKYRDSFRAWLQALRYRH